VVCGRSRVSPRLFRARDSFSVNFWLPTRIGTCSLGLTQVRLHSTPGRLGWPFSAVLLLPRPWVKQLKSSQSYAVRGRPPPLRSWVCTVAINTATAADTRLIPSVFPLMSPYRVWALRAMWHTGHTRSVPRPRCAWVYLLLTECIATAVPTASVPGR